MNPLSIDFWVNEAALLHGLVFELVDEIVGSGAYSAIRGVIQALLGIREPQVDFDMIDEAARAFARNYSFALVSRITDTSQRALQSAFAEWIASGEPLPALTEKLTPMFGPVRAEMVAVTEVTRIYSESNRMGWRELGIDTMRFQTARDDVVCPICEPFHGREYAIDDNDHAPPLHVRCRCYLQPVVKLPKMMEVAHG